MANKKPTRKMPADVKRTLTDRRTAKQEAKRRAKAPAAPPELDTEVVHVRLPGNIDGEALKTKLESPQGLKQFIDFLGLEGIQSALEVADPAEVADNAAVEEFAAAMRERLAQKRAQGYGGWNDVTQCDARKIAGLFMDKLFGTADGEDLGNYLAFLHHFGFGGQYALREVIKERLRAIHKTAGEESNRLREQLAVANKELEHARASAARAGSNLARALGYIDRVTEGEPPVADAPYREERSRIGDMEQVHISGSRLRGPKLDREESEGNSSRLYHLGL